MYRCSMKFMQLGEEYGNGTQLTVRVSGIGAKKFQVFQKLPRILADEGQSVLIPCEWTGNVSLTIGSFKWLKDGAEVSNQTAKYTGRVHRPQQDFIHSRNASLLLKELKVTDSGMYRCSVKFMQLGEEYGNGTQLTVRVKPKSSTTLWLFLLIGGLIELALLLIAVFYYVKLHRAKGAQPAQRQVQVVSEIFCVDDILTLPVMDEVQNLDQDESELESDTLCMVENNEDTSIYTPMESVKTFSNSTATEMDCQIPPPKLWRASSFGVQYATLVLDKTCGSSSLNMIAEGDDLEHDYGYDELNVTAKRYPKPEGIPKDEENGENPQECTEVVNK
ncbi:uncharacterized protein LOC132206215 [Stegostoma tigrinum]|uniref:uncharacterized protein LOC132206215 n=1 Tax=Stegostoma tigrinum TaxID=3053191 RepID=UPI002870134C|nr:uncharacterized protein LOC132206215 [Stegostoma tigrinum]